MYIMNRVKYNNINNVFDEIISFLDKRKEPYKHVSSVKKGGSFSEPYKSYKNVMDNVFRYFNIVQLEKESNQEKYAESVSDLEKECDCEKYKCKPDNTTQPDTYPIQESTTDEQPISETTTDEQPDVETTTEPIQENIENEMDEREPSLKEPTKLIRKSGMIE